MSRVEFHTVRCIIFNPMGHDSDSVDEYLLDDNIDYATTPGGGKGKQLLVKLGHLVDDYSDPSPQLNPCIEIFSQTQLVKEDQVGPSVSVIHLIMTLLVATPHYSCSPKAMGNYCTLGTDNGTARSVVLLSTTRAYRGRISTHS